MNISVIRFHGYIEIYLENVDKNFHKNIDKNFHKKK